MHCTHRTERLIVVEALYTEPHHLLPVPLHTLDYQTDTLRFEFPNDTPTLVALRLCGVTVPNDGGQGRRVSADPLHRLVMCERTI